MILETDLDEKDGEEEGEAAAAVAPATREGDRKCVTFRQTPSPQVHLEEGACSVSVDPESTRGAQSRELMKKRVLNQTLIIVGAFLVCWTPYVFITAWFVVDPSSAMTMSSSFNSYLFMFAVSNSVVNPFVYSLNLK